MYHNSIIYARERDDENEDGIPLPVAVPPAGYEFAGTRASRCCVGEPLLVFCADNVGDLFCIEDERAGKWSLAVVASVQQSQEHPFSLRLEDGAVMYNYPIRLEFYAARRTGGSGRGTN